MESVPVESYGCPVKGVAPGAACAAAFREQQATKQNDLNRGGTKKRRSKKRGSKKRKARTGKSTTLGDFFPETQELFFIGGNGDGRITVPQFPQVGPSAGPVGADSTSKDTNATLLKSMEDAKNDCFATNTCDKQKGGKRKHRRSRKKILRKHKTRKHCLAYLRKIKKSRRLRKKRHYKKRHSKRRS